MEESQDLKNKLMQVDGKKDRKKMLNHNLENYKGCSVNTVRDRQFRGVIKSQKNEEK